MARRPDTIKILIDGRNARPADVSKVAVDASRQRGRLTRELNGTAGRPRAERRREAKEKRERDAQAERDEKKMGQALRKQRRMELRAMRDEDIATRLAYSQIRQALAAAKGSRVGDMPIVATVSARPSAPAGWMPKPGRKETGARGSGSWRRAEDGLRSVQISVSAAVAGSKKSSSSAKAGKKPARWRRGDAVENVNYGARDHTDGAGEHDVITNMLDGRVRHVRSVDELERVLACVDVAEQVESEAAQHGRPHTMFKKLIFALPAELETHAHHQIMRKIANYFVKQGVPVLLARHTPDDAKNANIHVHGHVCVRRFAIVGPESWAFAAERADDVLCKASLAELRAELADALNEQLVAAGFEADFTHLSRLARGLAPANERHNGRKGTKNNHSQPARPAPAQGLPTPQVQDSAPELKTDVPQASQVAAPPNSLTGGVGMDVPDGLARPPAPGGAGGILPHAPDLPAIPPKIYTPPTRIDGAPEVEPDRYPPTSSGNGNQQPVIIVAGEGAQSLSLVPTPIRQPAPPSSTAEAAPLLASPTSSFADRVQEAATALGRALLNSAWERTPWRRVGQPEKAEQEMDQAKAELAQENLARADAERRAAEAAANRSAYWRSEFLKIIDRNHMLQSHVAEDVRNPRIYDDLEDRKFVQQTLANPDMSEVDRAAFLDAFRLARHDHQAAAKRAQEKREAAAYLQSLKQQQSTQPSLSSQRPVGDRPIATAKVPPRTLSSPAIGDGSNRVSNALAGRPRKAGGPEIGD